MRTAVLLITAAVAASGFASESLNATTFGKGRAEIRGDRDFEISRVTLQLYRDGRFRLFLNGEDRRSLNGTYRATGSRRYTFSVDTAFDSHDSRGNGWAQLSSGNRIDEVDISGNSDGRRFSIRFSSRGPNDDDWSGGEGGSGSSRGSGTLSYKGENDRLSTLTAQFDRDGQVKMVFGGEARVTVEGESRPGGRFIIERINGVRASGSGTADRITKDSAVVSLTGDYKGSRIRIDYRGRDNGGPSGGWGGSGGSWDNDSSGSFDSSQRGTGLLSFDGDRDDVNNASFRFDSNRRFRISFSGEAKGTIEGTWTRRNNVYNLEVTRINGNSARGSGVLTLSRSDAATVSVNASYKNKRLTFSFRAR